jgi:hypothetical protein
MVLLLAVVRPDFSYQRSAIVASGGWALVPDLHYVYPGPGGPLEGIKHTVFGDIFWFHRFLDGLHQGRGTRGGALLALVFLAATAVIVDTVQTRT